MLIKNSFRISFLFLLITTLLSCKSDRPKDEVLHNEGPKDKKVVALTFDDGPGINSEQILEILKKCKAKATFFMLGSEIEKRPKIAQKILKEGHEIGNHTYSHPNFWTYDQPDSKELLSKDIEKAEKSISYTLGLKPSLLRMPYGFVRDWVKDVARENDYEVISWTFGCDWKKMPKDEMVSQYLKHLKPGAIFLMHDGGGRHETTVESLPEIIEGIKNRGYKIVTISEMFGFGAEGGN